MMCMRCVASSLRNAPINVMLHPTPPPGARGGGNRGIGGAFDPKVEPQGGAKCI